MLSDVHGAVESAIDPYLSVRKTTLYSYRTMESWEEVTVYDGFGGLYPSRDSIM